MKIKLIRIFWDLDGVCAKWNTEASLEETYMPGYFAKRERQWNAISAMFALSFKYPEYQHAILSHYYTNGCALADKNVWCDEIERKCAPKAQVKRIFVPYGTSKYLYIDNSPDVINILIDDYTKNLLEWENAGHSGIKFLNGINNTHGTWKGTTISHTDTTEEIIRKVEERIKALCA